MYEKYFEKQLKDNKIITEELLSQLQGKSIYGDYKVGDKILWFMVQKIEMVDNHPEVHLTIKPITDKEIEKLEKDFIYVDTKESFPIFERVNNE